MNRSELEAALSDVAARLAGSGTTARVYIVGGAAMMLAYDSERTTRDVDGVVLDGHGPLMRAVADVARSRGLPTGWLNEQASVYIATTIDRRGSVVFDHPNLRVIAASAEHLLVMKAHAARATDLDDIAQLCELTGVASMASLEKMCSQVFPSQQLSSRSRVVLEEFFDRRRE